MKTPHWLCAGLFSICGLAELGAQTIVSYDFTGASASPSNALGGIGTTDITAGAFTDRSATTPNDDGISGSSESIYVRATATGSTTEAGNNLAGAIDASSYYTFSVTAGASELELASLSFNYWITSPADLDFQVYVMSSLGGFADGQQHGVGGYTPATADNDSAAEQQLFSIDLTGLTIGAGATEEFRLYFVDASSGQGRIHRLDDLTLTQAIDADPTFTLAAGSDPDLEFGTRFSTGSNVTRTLVYDVGSISGTGSILIEDVVLTGDPDAPGGLTVTDITPPVGSSLGDGETLSIEVTADGSATGSYTGTLFIDTSTTGNIAVDEYDQTLPVSAAFYEVGTKLNPNPYMDVDLTGWGGGSTRVEPGIAPGSQGMARVKGTGDPDGGNPDAHFQAAGVPDGTSDWTFSAYFTPIDIAHFGGYVDPEGIDGITGPDGSFLDRTFQWVLLGSDDNPPAPEFGPAQAANTILQVAYLPDGAEFGGTPDFYVFDGTGWVATGIGAIAGSVDNDTDGDPTNGFGDGRLDPAVDPADVVNVYQLTVTGTGFGGGSASYDLTVRKVSGPDSFPGGSATGLTTFAALSGNDHAPAAHAFASSDTSEVSALPAPDVPFIPPFWVDDACFINGAAPDPMLALVGEPGAALAFEPETVGTTTLRIRNDGDSASLTIDPLVFGVAGFSAGAPAPLAPGEVADITISFDSTVGGRAAEENVTLTSNAPVDGSVDFLASGGASGPSNLLANFDFEAPGTSPGDDLNTFALWDEQVGTPGGSAASPETTIDVPGLRGSGTAAYVGKVLPTHSAIITNLGAAVSDFVIDVDFAFIETENRQLNMLLTEPDAGVDGRLNLRLQGGVFDAFQGGWNNVLTPSPALQPSVDVGGDGSLDDPGDTKNVYRLRLTGSDFGSETASYRLEAFDDSDQSLGGSSAAASSFQGPDFTAGALFETIAFGNEFGNGEGFWVDNVHISGAVSQDPTIEITALQRSGTTVSINFTSEVNVDVYKSTDLSFGAAPIATDVAPGEGVAIDNAATEPAAFYVLVPTGEALDPEL